MNQALLMMHTKTLACMIGRNPRHYLSTHLINIQSRLREREGICVSLKTVSRYLHELHNQGGINLNVRAMRNDRNEFVGKRLIIKATSWLYKYVRISINSLKRFLTSPERTNLSPVPKSPTEVLREPLKDLPRKKKKRDLWVKEGDRMILLDDMLDMDYNDVIEKYR
jgi:hypothetical protein